MPTKQIHLFATDEDMKNLLLSVREKNHFRFAVVGNFDTPTVEIYDFLTDNSVNAIVEIFNNKSGASFLVSENNLDIQTREIPQRKGGSKYAVDQLLNPKTVVLRLGGVVEDKCIIAGNVGTVSDDSTSKEIYKIFEKVIRSSFTKVKSFYVGKQAIELMESGYRLTTDIKSPSIYDLKRD